MRDLPCAPVTARHDYERYMRARHRPAHGRRTAERWAGFLLPHLRPGMRLLDLGCGPGSITAGLAAGHRAVGVDVAPLASEAVPVAAADAAALPFPDACFDALYTNALLQHVTDPLAVLREARRVARPGAVIGVGDADWGGVLMHPADPALDRGQAVRAALRPGGEVRVGRQLRSLLDAAGFERCEASATSGADGTADATRRLAAFEASWFEAPDVVALVAERGIADPEEMAAIAAAWVRWGEDPGAFAARFWVTALAWAPG
jgi:SAM-dependent methyltransferase